MTEDGFEEFSISGMEEVESELTIEEDLFLKRIIQLTFHENILKIPKRVYYMEHFMPQDFCDMDDKIMNIIEKNSWGHEINQICVTFLQESKEYSESKSFSDIQTLALQEIFYHMFEYFMRSVTISRNDFYIYFRELLLLYAVQDPAVSLRIFSRVQLFGIAEKFSMLFDDYFDLLKAIAFPNLRLSINIIN